MTEYVRFSGAESIYGQKGILHSELDILNSLKRMNAFERLRSEEFALKFAFKNKLDELLTGLEELDKLLPHHKMHGLFKEEKLKEELEKKNEDITIEQELESIRRKLEKLENS